MLAWRSRGADGDGAEAASDWPKIEPFVREELAGFRNEIAGLLEADTVAKTRDRPQGDPVAAAQLAEFRHWSDDLLNGAIAAARQGHRDQRLAEFAEDNTSRWRRRLGRIQWFMGILALLALLVYVYSASD